MELRLGKVIEVDYLSNTIDVALEGTGGVIHEVLVSSALASTSAGCFELPLLKSVGSVTPGTILTLSGQQEQNPNLIAGENSDNNKLDIDDNSLNYAYAVVAPIDARVGRTRWVCLGFIFPYRNQVFFDPENVDNTNTALQAYVKDAVKKLKGGFLHRTNSDVYFLVDSDGNTEWSHPNGSFVRIAERPTVAEDGAVHVDLTAANRMAILEGAKTNLAWDTSLKTGLDQRPNASRKLMAHIEVVTAKGTVLIDIDKQTGNLTIKTPVDVSNANATNNQLTIISGGNAIIESVQGDVKAQAVNGNVTVEGKNTITLQTDQAARNSVVLAPNAGSQDNLVFLHKLISKFNNHQHICNHTGKLSSSPNISIDDTDGTSITIAG